MSYAPLGYYTPLGTDRFLGKGADRLNLLYSIQVDWNKDGAYDGWNESRFLIPGTFISNRGRENYLRPAGDGFERIGTGVCTFTLENSTGRYSPRNTSSPLYPHLLTTEERNARVLIKNGDSGELYEIITGQLVDFQPTSDGRGRQVLHMRIEDSMRYLRNREANIDIQQGIKTHEAIGMVLDDIGWPWGRDFENAVDTIPYWWVFGRSPYEETQELTESELGQFYIARNGDATFRSRFHADPAPLTLTGSEVSHEIPERQPAETMRDRVVVRVRPRIARATGTLWTLLDAPAFLPSGQSVEMWPEYTYNDRPTPALNPITEAVTDYSASSTSGGGADLTDNMAVTLSNFGQGGKLTIRNIGESDFYYSIKIRGDALDAPDVASAKAGNGERVFLLDLPWQQKIASGQDSADYLHSFLSNPEKYYLSVSMEGLYTKQFVKDLIDWVDLTIANRGISSMFRISKILHRGVARGVMRTTFWLEPVLGQEDISSLTQLPFRLPAQLP
jgi:hypothetical protein